MPHLSKEQIAAAREMDLMTYLRRFEPQELVHIGGDTYATRTHDSLKISMENGAGGHGISEAQMRWTI